MNIVGVFEAKNRLSELVDRAGRGEEIVITRRGQRIARLVPMAAADLRDRTKALAQQIRQTRAAHALGAGPSIREMVDEGRR